MDGSDLDKMLQVGIAVWTRCQQGGPHHKETGENSAGGAGLGKPSPPAVWQRAALAATQTRPGMGHTSEAG